MGTRRPGLNFFIALSLAAGLLLDASATRAAGTPIPHGTLEMIAENQSVAPGHQFYLGLHFELEKGWHVYWVNPGDSGEPPKISWQLPVGIAAGAIEWPTPGRLGTSTIVDYGYQDAVTLIVPMRAATSLSAAQPVQISAAVKVLVCREMCIPGKAQLALTLPVKSQLPAPNAQAKDFFAVTRRSLPQPAPKSWKLTVTDTKDTFVLTANLGHRVTQAAFFPEAESQIDNAAPQNLAPQAAGFKLTLKKSDQLLKPIDRLKGDLVLSPDQSYAIDVRVAKPNAARNPVDNGIQTAKLLEEEPPK